MFWFSTLTSHFSFFVFFSLLYAGRLSLQATWHKPDRNASVCHKIVSTNKSTPHWTIPISSIHFDNILNISIQYEARTLNIKICKFETIFFCSLWKSSHNIWATAAIQAIETDLCNPVDLVCSQTEYVSGLCCQFESFEASGRKISQMFVNSIKETHRKWQDKKRLSGFRVWTV